ncbi:MAG TPA: Rieske (2Fe-2S) protein [Steroidobacteraceae bacterium]|nr:Rieske (2Fe-2S) protein [Steroidobacteraceae bacterium]
MSGERPVQFPNRWFPVARIEEVVARHIVQAQVLGQEIAIWRDDTGFANAWENRCPHRGVRLSIGLNTGHELRCQYHGWRYSSRSGQCSFIPAQPDRKPANAIRATTYGCTEQYGFVWVNLSNTQPTAPLPSLVGDSFTTLRSTHVDAPLSRVKAFLERRRASVTDGGPPDLVEIDVPMRDPAENGTMRTTLLMQPMSDTQTVIHGIVAKALVGNDRLALLRSHDAYLTRLRDEIENLARRDDTHGR